MDRRTSVVSILIFAWLAVRPAGQQPAGYQRLVELHKEIVALRQPAMIDGGPDYRTATIDARRRRVAGLRTALGAIDPSAWAVSQQVDYHVARAASNDIDFTHRVVRPWARDASVYVDHVARIPYEQIPAASDKVAELRTRLRTVPAILDGARRTLTSASGELAGIAIRRLQQSDGINQGEPRREVPPEGVIGWYQDLIARLTTHHPDLVADARKALGAIESYRDWLKQAQPAMKEPAGVGLENYNWYLRHVRLMPYTADDVRKIGAREEHRARAFLAIERHRNLGLPPLEPATSAEEHERRVRQAETRIREHIRKLDFLTIPPDTPPQFETDAFWIVRPGGKRHFWEELTYRDPLNNHIHASIPGHRLDGLIQRRNPNPIRQAHRDGARAEGWGFYLEEALLQSGLLDGRPRARELFYIAQLKRAIRIPCELKMQTGAFTLQQAIDYMVQEVPLMEPDLARYDLIGYLRQPTYGMNYFMGKVQLEELLADRVRQLGDRFHLGRFHDEFLAAGPIPISLIRWELTGVGDNVTALAQPGTMR